MKNDLSEAAIPFIGLGTWNLRGKECTEIVKQAIELGYRHIDTAHTYENHKEIGKAIQGFERSKLFLTSKFSLDQIDLANIEDSVEKACDLALKELKATYLDLYLIHWANHTLPLSKIFKAMHPLIQGGKIIRAGVSNFNIHHLKDLHREGCIPFANQVEFHPYLYQKDLLDYCHTQGINLIAYRPFGKKALLEEPLFEKIGLHYKKTGAQVILRWLIQQGIPVIPKASSKKHLQENLQVFDFSLTASEMKELANLNRGQRFCNADNPEFNY